MMTCTDSYRRRHRIKLRWSKSPRPMCKAMPVSRPRHSCAMQNARAYSCAYTTMLERCTRCRISQAAQQIGDVLEELRYELDG